MLENRDIRYLWVALSTTFDHIDTSMPWCIYINAQNTHKHKLCWYSRVDIGVTNSLHIMEYLAMLLLCDTYV